MDSLRAPHGADVSRQSDECERTLYFVADKASGSGLWEERTVLMWEPYA